MRWGCGRERERERDRSVSRGDKDIYTCELLSQRATSGSSSGQWFAWPPAAAYLGSRTESLGGWRRPDCCSDDGNKSPKTETPIHSLQAYVHISSRHTEESIDTTFGPETSRLWFPWHKRALVYFAFAEVRAWIVMRNSSIPRPNSLRSRHIYLKLMFATVGGILAIHVHTLYEITSFLQAQLV